MSTDRTPPGSPRQRVVRVPGSRRAKLTPAPGTTDEPAGRDAEAPRPTGPNDERMRREKPPHY
ncbi:hypothetical protein [Microbacterium luticocti]|uniref:hypothetical protein n=1 Tax=Microbacterium luticocti TaxID=451764 RepID=UPI00048D0B00|nr:hypothetical protein [Microbacterium luticocti]